MVRRHERGSLVSVIEPLSSRDLAEHEQSTALKDLLSVAERDPVDLDAGGLPYGIDQ